MSNPGHEVPQGPRGARRRTVALGAAWTVPIVATAHAAPAFAASPNVSLLQAGCATSLGGFDSDCGILITYARLTWQLTTQVTIPINAEFRMSASRALECRHNRVTGSLRDGGFVALNASSSTVTSAIYRVLQPIPSGTYTLADGFAVQTGAPTVITLTAPTVGGEDTSDNSASRSVRTILGTSCS